MGHDFRSMFHMETRRLIWLIATVFAVVLVVQYLELPYGNVISSLFTTGKAPIGSVSSSHSSFPSQMVANTTLLNGPNSTETFSVHEISNDTVTAKGHDRSPGNYSFSERDGGLNKSFELEENGDPEDESPSKDFAEINKNSTMDNANTSDYGAAPEMAMEPEYSISFTNATENNNSTLSSIQEDSMPSPFERSESSTTDLASPSPAFQPINSSPNVSSTTNLLTNVVPPAMTNHNSSLVDKDAGPFINKDENSGPSLQIHNSSVPSVPAGKKRHERSTPAVVSISEMNDMLHQSRASYRSMVFARLHIWCFILLTAPEVVLNLSITF